MSERWHYRRSLASRVTLLTTIAVGLAVAFVALGVYFTVRVQLTNTLDDSLRERAGLAARSSTLFQLADMQIPTAALGAADVRIAFVYADGRVWVPDPEGRSVFVGVLARPELAVAQGDRESSIRTIQAREGGEYRVVTLPTTRPGQALVLAQSLEPHQRVLTRLGIVMLAFGVLGVVAAGFAGWAVAASGLRPVRRLTKSVEHIARTEDLTPLPVEGDDEIARLATAFNGMLVALAASRDRQRQLVADAGHELRTPLTSMRTNIDLLSQAGLSLDEDQRGELLADVRAQMEELTTLIGDLVELARDEPLTPVVGAVELHEVVEHAVGRVRLRAPSVTFETDVDPWWVVGEEHSLERAVTNVLDNAAKWSPADGTVRVGLHEGLLTVDDEGPGIGEADIPHVFDRFYRSPESRSMPGSGLGLSIVRQVAERHAGTVSAGRAPSGGARLELRLPGAAAPMPKGIPTRASS